MNSTKKKNHKRTQKKNHKRYYKIHKTKTKLQHTNGPTKKCPPHNRGEKSTNRQYSTHTKTNMQKNKSPQHNLNYGKRKAHDTKSGRATMKLKKRTYNQIKKKKKKPIHKR